MRNSSVGTDTEEVAGVLEALLLWLRRQVPAEFSYSTISTLATLRDGPLRISELADREAISQPGMTTLVNRLEAAGHAQRMPDPTDGRASLVRITDAGRAVLASRHVARTEALSRELERLDAADRSAIVAALPALARLVNHAKENTDLS